MFLEILNTSFSILLSWRLLLVLGLFGISAYGLFGWVASSSVSNREMSSIMTFITYLEFTVLMFLISTLLLITNESTKLIFSFELVLSFLVFGALGRLIGMPLYTKSPNFASYTQILGQLGVLASFTNVNEVIVWPGALVFATILFVGYIFIFTVDAIIEKNSQNPVSITILLSGFIVVIPACQYAGWLQLTNGF